MQWYYCVRDYHLWAPLKTDLFRILAIKKKRFYPMYCAHKGTSNIVVMSRSSLIIFFIFSNKNLKFFYFFATSRVLMIEKQKFYQLE